MLYTDGFTRLVDEVFDCVGPIGGGVFEEVLWEWPTKKASDTVGEGAPFQLVWVLFILGCQRQAQLSVFEVDIGKDLSMDQSILYPIQIGV